MALVLKDRVKETANGPGTGSVTLLGASTGFQSFSVIGNGNTCYYTISDQGGPNWEVGIGTYSTTGPTLARTTVLASSNAGSLTNFNAGTQDVFVTYPSEKGVWLDASGNAIGLGTPAAFVGTNITGTASGLSIGGNAATATTASAATGPLNGSLGATTPSTVVATTISGTDLTTTGNTILGNASTDTLNVGNGGLVQDASGNVGIGTASPNTKLNIVGTNTTTVSTASTYLGLGKAENGLGGLRLIGYGYNPDSSLYVYPAYSGYVETYNSSGTAGDLVFYTRPTGSASTVVPTERMRIDASGNVGVGVTPSAWTLTPALQVLGASLASGGNDLYLTSNAFYGSGAWTYKATAYSSQYYQLNGTHVWRTAPSGTAGTAITFTQAMTLDASGKLGIGVIPSASTWVGGAVIPTLDIGKSEVYAVINVKAYSATAGAGGILSLGHSKSATVGTQVATALNDALGFISFEGVNSSSAVTGGAYVAAFQSGAAGVTYIPADLIFYTSTGSAAPTERMRINNAGAVNIAGLTASSAVATDASKNLVSVTNTGSGNNVLATSPTLVTPVLGAATGTSLSVSSTVTGAELLASNGLIINNMTIGTTYAIPSGYSASSVGPVVISGGVTITVGAGSRWVVL